MARIKIIYRDLGLLTIIICFLLVVVSSLYTINKLEDDWLLVTRPANESPDIVYSVNCHHRILSFNRDYYAGKEAEIKVQRRIFDINTNASYVVPDQPYVTEVGFKENQTFYLVVPRNIPNGEYIYVPRAFYDINAIKRVAGKQLPSVNFKLVGDCKNESL